MMNRSLPTLEIGDWRIRYRKPVGEGPHPVLWLLHGWKGDENSMWIFAKMVPEHYLLLAPRGPYPEPGGGYSWYPLREPGWPPLENFIPAVYGLLELMEAWPLTAPWGDFERFRVAGFSQGAALAYSLALTHPQRVSGVAGLAGFLPVGTRSYFQTQKLDHLKVYISHGNQDQIVPLEWAKKAVRRFDAAGAEVIFCESDVGHKLNANCFKGLEDFWDTEGQA